MKRHRAIVGNRNAEYVIGWHGLVLQAVQRKSRPGVPDRATRVKRIYLCFHLASALLFAPAHLIAESDSYQKQFREGQQNIGAVGATGCASCHGSGNFLNSDNQKMLEYKTWRGDDDKGPHYLAYQAMENERGKRMIKTLAEFEHVKPEQVKEKRCVSCHSFGQDVPQQKRFRTLTSEEAVSCEACHGRGGEYLGPHWATGWHEETPEKWMQLGMYDTRNLVRWAEKCTECHIGTTEDRKVTHTMMGAGHPDLRFELGMDLLKVPKHSRDKRTQLPNEGKWYYARRWAVGQAVTLRESMRRLENWANSIAPVDYALFQCYDCHHDLKDSTARQGLPRIGQPAPGQPVCDPRYWTVVRHLVVLLSEDEDKFDTSVKVIAQSLSIANIENRAAVGKNAHELAVFADQLTKKVADHRFDAESTAKLLQAIAADNRVIAGAGPRAAEQASNAIHILYRQAWSVGKEKPETAEERAVWQSLGELEKLVYDADNKPAPENFRADAFIAVMQKLAEQFSKLKPANEHARR